MAPTERASSRALRALPLRVTTVLYADVRRPGPQRFLLHGDAKRAAMFYAMLRQIGCPNAAARRS